MVQPLTCMSHCTKQTPNGARLLQLMDTSGFISAADGVGEAQERLSKQRLHKSGSYNEHSSVCFKGVATAKTLSLWENEKSFKICFCSWELLRVGLIYENAVKLCNDKLNF